MKIKQKIILALFALFLFFTSATLISTWYIRNTTEELFRLVTLHQIEALRRNLVISIQTVQSDLYTVHTPLGHELDMVVANVASLDEAAQKCPSCHHREAVYEQLEAIRSGIGDYKIALSYYITAAANKARIESIKLDAAKIGQELLRLTENMSAVASETLVNRTKVAMANMNYARTLIIVILLSSLVLGILVSVYLTRSITRPIQELVAATKTIASGSLGHTIAHKDQTEFGELASNFNKMSITLKEGYDRVAAANRELQREISERERVEGQLRQAHKMQAIGTLAGGIAHDFNNILMTMINHAELALHGATRGGSVWHHLDKILMGGKRAKELIRQIIFFSRQSEQERKPVQMDALASDLLMLLRGSLPSNIELRQSLDARVGTVKADPTQMHQVLMNLCANAAHAMRDKGGVLEVGVGAVEVDQHFAALHPELRPGPHVLLSVRDTGHGMTPEVLERIFEPFFTTKEVGQGSGMGLAVVHGIIAKHGGAIAVESRPGVGTTFAIYLPRVNELPHREPDEDQSIPRGTERILYVDDEEDLVEVIRETLGSLGYDVVGKTKGVEALDAFRTMPDRFDLIITDQTMPDMTGEELTRQFRQIRPDIPIILCTGFSHVIDGDNAKIMGIDAFCLKPLGARDLGITIRRVLAHRVSRTETSPASLS